ncbi:MAG: redox-regulated ATPase YchF, partial [Gemmatimonadales bacterium]|nr:redox-regulated ATPase YchF [Gemmatimonadales bacterium]
ANYPFATIEPNTGVVQVPDPRLDALAAIVRPERTLPATVEFVDIAGLVKGASQGEGLGNQFLANIREVDAIVHAVRCFEDDDIQHVMGSVDPVRDRDVINIELGLADLASVEKRLDKAARTARSGDAQAKIELRLLEALQPVLASGRAAREVVPTEEERPAYRAFNLLTSKPVLYAANVAEEEINAGNRFVDALRAALASEGEAAEIVTFSAKVEAELAELPPEDRTEFLESLGLTESGLDRLGHAAYHLLGLQSYFTAGEKEVRAWTIHRGDKAPAAAGVIHSDFEKGFIRAETVSYDDFVRVGGWKPARDQGLARAEGKEYVVRDGDVLLFRFSS